MVGPVLNPCRACHRHVRSEERSCPFCGARTPSLLRGVRNVAAAAAILSASACADDVQSRGAEIYGGPPADQGDEQNEADPEPNPPPVDRDLMVPAYGGPPPPPEPPPPVNEGDEQNEADPGEPIAEPPPVPAYGGPRPPTE